VNESIIPEKLKIVNDLIKPTVMANDLTEQEQLALAEFIHT
jgi:hypothetical protein